MDNTIKQFLYLNHDLLFSCYSQIAGSVPYITTSSSKKESSHNKQKDESIGAKLEASINIFGNKIDGNLSPEISNKTSLLNTDGYQKSVESYFHDSLFNNFENLLDLKKLIPENGNHISNFIKCSGDIEIVDMEYYNSLFNNKKLIDYLSKEEVGKQIPNNNTSSNTGRIKNEVNQKYKTAQDGMNMLHTLIPFERFIIIEDNIAVLNDNYLKDNPNDIVHKYSGKMTILGYITNIITTNNINKDTHSPFAQFSKSTNEILLSLLGKDNLRVINPIGIYYETRYNN